MSAFVFLRQTASGERCMVFLVEETYCGLLNPFCFVLSGFFVHYVMEGKV